MKCCRRSRTVQVNTGSSHHTRLTSSFVARRRLSKSTSQHSTSQVTDTRYVFYRSSCYKYYEQNVPALLECFSTMATKPSSATAAASLHNKNNLSSTWREFLHALKRSREPFNPWWWIYRLTTAAVNEYMVSTAVVCRRLVPLIALTLVNLVGLAYFGVLRGGIIQKRWCCDGAATDDMAASATCKCAWLYVHDAFIVYNWCMILWHLLQAAYSSPGIVPNESNIQKYSWIHAKKEEEQLRGYESLLLPINAARTATMEAKGSLTPQPSPHADASWCQQCQTKRPPRCHHCRTCGVCVLEFDHHCIFLNNCIGYYNYRSFLLAVFFLTLACWYGVVALYVPFYEPLQVILQKYGGFVPYMRAVWNGEQPFVTYEGDGAPRGLFHVPSMDSIYTSLQHDSEYRVRVLMEALFPLLLSVGALLSGFLGMHVKWTTQGLTSLDYRARTTPRFQEDKEEEKQSRSVWRLLQIKSMHSKTENPFDQGSPYRNWAHRMGTNPFLLFVPCFVSPSTKQKRG